jgi:type II secretion system protein N
MAFAAKNNKWPGYALYVVLVTLALLYYLFPAQMVEELIESSVSKINPEFVFQAEKIRPWIPPSLRISGGRIYLSNTTGPAVFETGSVNIRPQFMKLLGGKYDLKLSGTAYKGDINGSLHLAGPNGEAIESELFFEDLDLVLYEFLADKFQHKLTGMFSGNVDYARNSAAAPGTGKAVLHLADGQLQLQDPIFGIGSVDLQSINLEMELRNRNVTIVKGELTGVDLNGSLAGSILLQSDLKNSQLNLKGTIEPQAEFYRKYPEIRELLKSMKKRVKRGQYFFTINGTLGQPRFNLL